jgi:selenocysteine-specific elongation factor
VKRLIVGTAGHIDHGKTSLVRVLTGVDTDRLPEEKARGITIELGFTHLTLPSGEVVGIVDVPGHERFVRHMVAGASGIDLVMLVIAADEGVMPQTREHLEICTLLGIERGMTVLTKADLVEPEWLEMVTADVRNYLSGSFLAGAPLVAASARTGEGIEAIRETLARLVAGSVDRSREGFFRLPVDRSFVMKGFGTVVTGTTLAGTIRVGEEVEVVPGGSTGRVRGIEVYGEKVEEAAAGCRTALNIQGLHREEIPRGAVIVRPGTFRGASGFFGEVRLLSSARRLKEGERVRFHVGTAELLGRCYPMEAKEIPPGGSGLVDIRLEEPAVASAGDRFVLRSYSPAVTIGGGSVITPREQRRRRRTEVVAELKTAREGSARDLLLLAVRKAGRAGITAAGLSDILKVTDEALAPEVAAAVADGSLVRIDGPTPLFLAGAAARLMEEEIATMAKEAVAKDHLSHGAPLDQVRSRSGAGEKVFEGIVARMVAGGTLSRRETSLAPPGHRAASATGAREEADRLADLFRKEGLTPRETAELLKELGLAGKKGLDLIAFLLKEGTLVRIKEEYIVHRGAIEELVAKLREFLSSRKELTVADFKELTGTSRKFTIPLLEHLDRSRVTLRVGESRKLRGQGA